MTATALPWHAEVWARFNTARGAGRVAHAMLIRGPEGLGKLALARRISAALVCQDPQSTGDACGKCASCRLSAAGSHPDQFVIEPEEPGKQIKIHAIRELSRKSVLSAQDGGYRVFIIHPADAMNRASANALLKTLEEPTPRCVLLLVSSQPDRLAATIRSRCQEIKLSLPPADKAVEWLRAQMPEADVEGCMAIAGGAPLRALRALDGDWPGEDRRLADELGALKLRTVNPMQVVEDWGKRPITQVMDGIKRWNADLIRFANGSAHRLYHPGQRADLQKLSQDIDLKKLYEFNDEVVQMGRDALNNLNPEMMLERLANGWLHATRPRGR